MKESISDNELGIFKGRLAKFRDWNNTSKDWTLHWQKHSIANALEKHSNGYLGEYEQIFTQYLPKDLPVLEAGCGMGQIVKALSSRGYLIEGIDYSEETVKQVNKQMLFCLARIGVAQNEMLGQ